MKNHVIGSRARTFLAVVASLALVGGMAVSTAPAAAAEPGAINASQTVTKTSLDADGAVAPGETFSYRLDFSCGTSIAGVSGCGGARITDVLPQWLELVSVGPFPTAAPGTSSVTEEDGRDRVALDFTAPVDVPSRTTGLPLGGFTMQFTVRLSADAPWEIDGTTLTNVASMTSVNAADSSGSADIVAKVPRRLAATATKSFSPDQNFNTPGQRTDVALGATNATNGGVDTLSIQDPAGSPSAGSGSPFFYLAFEGFGAVVPPAGADAVQAEVWTPSTGWTTVYSGASPPVYPESGAPAVADVHGVRLTWSSLAPGGIARGAAAAANLALTQRANVAGLPPTTVTNPATAGVGLAGEVASSPVASDDYRIVPFGIQVNATKTFDPDRIRAGESTTVRLSASNTGTAPLSVLRVSEPGAGTSGALSDELAFTGFATGVQWPDGATSARIEYRFADGTTSAPSTTTTVDSLPAVPSGAGRVVGFDIDFLASGAPGIAAGAEARVPFTATTSRPTPLPDVVEVPNEVAVSGTSLADPARTASATASDTLEIFGDRIGVGVSKVVTPGQAWLLPGQSVIAQIPATVSAFPATTVDPTRVVVDDASALSPGWWNLYDATELTQLGIPANGALTVQYTTDGSTYTDLPGAVGLTAPPAFRSIAVPPALSADIVGLRFVYDALPGETFSPGTTLQPNVTFTTRAITRDGTPIDEVTPNATIPDTTAPGGQRPVVQTANCAAAGARQDPLAITATTAATDPCPTVVLVPTTGGPGPDLVDKDLTPRALVERSQATGTATLRWSTGGLTGVRSQTITETGSTSFSPATTGSLTQSFFDSFDLVRIPAITTASDPRMRYDRVASVELFDSATGTWSALSGAPWDGPSATNGTVFPGYTLTDAQRATTTGVRFTIEESPNRSSVLTPGDLTQPAVGSGVTSSIDRRSIPLEVVLRDQRRGDGTPVLAGEAYNSADPGVVTNTVESEACLVERSGGICADGLSSRDAAALTILDGTATITTGKTWTGGPLGLPPTTTPLADYPTSRATLTVVNNGPQKVDAITLADPAPNTVSAGSAYDAFDLDRIVSVSIPTGATATSLVLRYADGTRSAALTVDQARALSATQLRDVVGLEAASTGRIGLGRTNGRLEVVVDLRLRQTLRSDPSTPVPAPSRIPNTLFGSISDPSVEEAGSCAVSDPMIAPPAETVIGCASAELALVQNQDRSVVASKSLSPAQQFENEDQRITATLTGTPGGTARSNQVVLTDDTAAFWNAYGFAGLSSQFAIASPANRVKVEVLTGVQYSVDPDNTIVPAGGSWKAVTGVSGSVWKTAAQARSALPDGGPLTMVGTDAGVVTYSQVQGVRVTFQRVASNAIADPAAPLLLLENPATPALTARILLDRREALLTGGPVPTTLAGSQPAPGTTEAGRYPNTVVATASGVADNGPTVSDDASADMLFRHLPTRATVEKTPAGQVQPGVPFTVTLRSTNSGAYPIIDPVIVDSLPVGGVVADLPDLVFPAGVDPTDPSIYSVSLTGGTAPGAPWASLPLSSSGLSVEVTRSGGAAGEPVGLRFTFADGSALGLGQSYAISFPMQLRPGAVASQTFVNRFSLGGERAFDACNGNGPLRETCETQAEITVQPLASLEMHQEVRAEDAELGVVSSTTQVCTPADATADGFYRAPCVPVTKPGATDTWRLQYRNTGSYPLATVSSIVYLPELGASGIDITSARSDWRATLSSMLALRAGDNPTALLNVRYSTVTPGTALCDAVLNPNGSCAPGYWRPLDASVDLSTVTALYVTVDFGSLSDALAPNDTFALTFTTRAPANAPAPQTNPIAWNSVKSGATYTASGTQTLLPFEVPVVGAALATGSVSLVKTVDGPAAAADWVPSSFSGSLACVSAGEDVPASALPTVSALTAGKPVQIDGLPWGAQCRFVEAEAGSSVTLTPDRVTAATAPGAVAQQDVANTYRYASLTVSKKVTAATGFAVPTGFGFAARCEYLGDVVLDERFLLDADQSREFTGLPARAACTVTETDARDADSTVAAAVVVDPLVAPVVDQESRTVTIPELSPDKGTASQNTATFDNLFGVGALLVGKSLVGGAADQYGADKTFDLDVVCTFGGETLVDTTVSVGAATGWSASVTGVVAGSECRVTEPDLEGADAVVLTPDDGVVVVPAEGTASVLVTNRYLAGSLQVTKVLDGEGAVPYGTGSFTFSLACVRDGVDVVIPGGGDRTVDARSPIAEYTGLASGAECTLRETDVAGAGESVILDAGGSVLARDEGYTFTVVVDPTAASDADQPQPALSVRNTFRLAQVSVSKTVQSSAVDAAGVPLPYGPFTVDLSCTFEGSVVSALEPSSRSIAAGETVTWTGLPEGALCGVEESDRAGAARSTVDVTEGGRSTGPVAGADAALAPLPDTDAPDQTSVMFSNAFDVSTLSVSKALEGSGAASVDRTFPVHVLCTLVDATRPAGLVVRDVRGDIGGSAGTVLRLADVPAGAVCAITETDTGGAVSTSVTTTAPDGTLTRVGASTASVVLTAGATGAVVTNRFEQPLAVTGNPLSSVLPAAAVLALIAGVLLLLCRPRRREV